MHERNTFGRELALLREREVPKAAPPPKPKPKQKHVVLVACHDHESHGHLLSVRCQNRINRLFGIKAKIATDPLWRFTMFDVTRGVRTEYEISKGKRTWVDKQTFSPVTAAIYTGKQFRHSPAGVISVMDVYSFVQDLGANADTAGTLVELSFFGHGWIGGPILVNSFDNQPADPARDPDDKDGRVDMDFEPPNMTAAQLANLRAAYAPDGYSWLWGCVFARSPHQVMYRFWRSAAARNPKIKDTDVVKLEFTQDDVDRFFRIDPTFFPQPDSSGKAALRFNRTLAEIKDFFNRRIGDSYCSTMAVATQRRCMGALPGTYSDYEVGVRNPLMLVPTRVPPYADNFSRSLQFYRQHLGRTLDPEGRNYGVYEP